jgi:hypothetical protein
LVYPRPPAPTNTAIFDVSRDIERKDVEVAEDGLDLLKKARGAFTGATVAKFGRGKMLMDRLSLLDDLSTTAACGLRTNRRRYWCRACTPRQSQVDCLQWKQRRIEIIWELIVEGKKS